MRCAHGNQRARPIGLRFGQHQLELAYFIAAKGNIEPEFSEDEIKAKIAGEPLVAAKASLLALPDLANAKISLWPFWLNGLPKNTAKIKVSWN